MAAKDDERKIYYMKKKKSNFLTSNTPNNIKSLNRHFFSHIRKYPLAEKLIVVL